MQAYLCFIKLKIMQKLIMILTAFLLLVNTSNAQLKKTWKNQIYGGINKSLRSEALSVSHNYDLTYVSKQDWLFNSGFTYMKYISSLNQAGFSGINFSAKPTIKVKQINLSVGRRVDLSPKWSLSLYAGISYTHCTYPTDINNYTIKYGVFIPISYNRTSAEYAAKESLGLHLNSELNFYLCDNIMLHAGYMYDFNSAHNTGGFTIGGRVGLMKQKHGTRRISSLVRI